MSFRKELKSIITKNKILKLKNWILQNNGKILYPERSINSIYLDNEFYSIYQDSIEGTVPRKKIRIRNYNKKPVFNLNNNNLEIKVSSPEGRFKTTKKTNISNLHNYKIYDCNYGSCRPVTSVSYKRIYYLIKNVRLTIDTNIIYRKIQFGKISNFPQYELHNVVELKYQDDKFNDIIQKFPFHFVRFSKYSRSIDYKTNKYGIR